MGAVASNYWRLSKLLTKENALVWIQKDMWTVHEASALLIGQSPDHFNGYDTECQMMQDWINPHVVDETPNRMGNKILSLYGFKTKERSLLFDSWYIPDLCFPVAAYFNFAMTELFPRDQENFDFPCFGIFHDLQKETDGQDVIEPIEPAFAMALKRLGCNHPLLIAEPSTQEDMPPWEELPEQIKQTCEHVSPQPIPEAPNDQVIIDGLTVADVRTMCERSAALASVLRAAAEWQAIEKENPKRRTEEALKARLAVAARKDGWGTSRGEISPTQSDLLDKLITDGFRSGGRPRKKAND